MSDESWRGWADNVAKKLIAERDAAEARYLREHRRAVFLADMLQGIETGVGDPQASRHRKETWDDLWERIEPYLGRFINAFSDDMSWIDQHYDFEEWERDYFGPRHDTTSTHSRPEEDR